MLSQCWSYASYCNSNSMFSQSNPCGFFSDSKTHHFYSFRMHKKSTSPKITCLQLSLEDIAGIAQNKVLIAAGVSAAVGQLSKPFTSVILYGKDFDLKVALQAGGFPSTHSSGVRREVGNQARVMNKLVSKSKKKKKQVNSVDDSQLATSSSSSSSSMEGRAFVNEQPNAATPFLIKSENRTRQASQLLISPSTDDDSKEESENSLDSFNPLKESIGHTEVEVIAGALLGFFVSLAVYATL